MRNISTVLFVSTLFFVSPVMAGAGHDQSGGHSHGPISSAAVIKKAVAKVESLAASGKLDKSWVESKAIGASQKSFSNKTEWVVTFKNDKVTDVSKQTLYLFFSLDGGYIATNFTGK